MAPQLRGQLFNMRNRHIDRLRGVAVLTVMISHSTIYLPWFLLPIPVDYTNILLRNGYYGVCLFFAISGFLITSKVVGARQRTFSTRDFYTQRIGRILPCLALMVATGLTLAFLAVPNFTFSTELHPISRLLFYIFTFRFNEYLTSYGSPVRSWDILWSLSVEEVFYLSFPVIFGLPLLFPRIDKRLFVIPFLITVAITGPIVRTIYGHVGIYYYFGAFDQIALGSLTAVICESISTVPIAPNLLRILRQTGIGLFAFVYLTFSIENYMALTPSFVALGACLYLAGSRIDREVGRSSRLIFAALERFGELSYEMYLFHMILLLGMVQIVLPMFSPASAWLTKQLLLWSSVAAYLSIIYIGCLTISKFISEPANRAIRNRLSRPDSQRFEKGPSATAVKVKVGVS